MCSIAGSANVKDVQTMLSLMNHRAPDDSGIISDGSFAMGMGRLAIIDLISPHLCPIQDENYVLVFNGELFNYLELKEELIKLGHTFNTKSDSEVLLKAFREWGKESLAKFNWMGAFAIYDGRHIFLARDISGEKPLYYSLGPFEFASESKALGFHCYEFPPARFGTYDPDTGELTIEQYWHKPTHKYEGSFEEATEELEGLLGRAVELRTRADVPYGLYLSGGIDSTLISTYHRFSHRFTYRDGDFKEEFLEVFPRILWHLDGPVKTFTPFGLWKLAEEASKKVKVVLSGEGADELFGGYIRYVPNEFNRKARERFPSYRALFPFHDMLQEEFDGNMRELLRMGDRMASAFGMENRCPFLDKNIIEFAMSLPMEWKINGYETKIILRELLKKRKPDYEFEEKKGLYCSVNEWLGEKDPFDKRRYISFQEELWKKFVS